MYVGKKCSHQPASEIEKTAPTMPNSGDLTQYIQDLNANLVKAPTKHATSNKVLPVFGVGLQ